MDRMMRRLFVMISLLAASVLAACGDEGSEDAATTTTAAPSSNSAVEGSGEDNAESVDGCSIVTAADAEAVLGVPVERSDEATEPQQMLASCIWDGGAGTGSMALVNRLLQLYVYDGAAFYAPDQYGTMPGFEEIDGFGDGAFAYGTGSFDLLILSGDRTISLGASGFTPDDRARVRQAVLDLASEVLDRM